MEAVFTFLAVDGMTLQTLLTECCAIHGIPAVLDMLWVAPCHPNPAIGGDGVSKGGSACCGSFSGKVDSGESSDMSDIVRCDL